LSIGIVGAGAAGSAIAVVLARAGLSAKIVNRRGERAMAALLAGVAPQVSAGTHREVLQSDIVFVAVPWVRLGEALADAGGWANRIVVDCTNAIEGPSFRAVELNGLTSSEALAAMVPGARVVKSFNHVLPQVLAGDPAAEGGRRVMFLAGDDAAATQEVGKIIDASGWFRIDLGGLREGGRLIQFPGGPLSNLTLVSFD
jgi:predicted dinucleotide-binding enzyme